MRKIYSVSEFIRCFHADAVEAVLSELLDCAELGINISPVVVDDEVRIYADLSEDVVERGVAIQWAIPTEDRKIAIYYTVNGVEGQFDTIDDAEEAFGKFLRTL